MKRAWCSALGAALLLALAACTGARLGVDAAAAPLIYDTAAGTFISERALAGRLAAVRFPLLGEVHDNPAPHRARAQLLGALVRAGRRPAVVMEQFDLPQDRALAAAQAAGAGVEAVVDAGRLDRRAWQWPLHAPLVAAALELHLPLRAGNVPAAELRPVLKDGALPAPWQALLAGVPWSPAQEAALREEIRAAHCGSLPEALVPGFAVAQRVRDALMARALVADATADGAVLIAGNGHVRHDRGVPVYLPHGQSASVAFLEVDDGDDALQVARDARSAYDYVWLVAGVARADPCAALRSGASPLQAVPRTEEAR